MKIRNSFGFVRKAIVASVALGGLAMAQSASVAAPNNPGFEALPDFSGWSTTGSTAVVTSSFYSPVPEGTVQAAISNGSAFGGGNPSVVSGDLESFFGAAASSLNLLGGGQAYTGSGIKQSNITIAPGEVLTFQYNLLTNEGATGTVVNNDEAFISVGNGTTTTFTKFASASDATLTVGTTNAQNSGENKETGLKTYTFQLAPGTYTLGVGVVNVGDASGTSILLVDNFQSTTGGGGVPLPAGAMLAPVVGGLAALVARRMRKNV